MTETQLLMELIGKGGVAALLSAAVYYVSKKLASAYEARIAALERASEICEKDRVELRNLIIEAKFKDYSGFAVQPNSRK